MKTGDTGYEVTALQRQLNSAGFNITADGWFGKATEAAVIAFQRQVGLVADGGVGPRTQAALDQKKVDRKHLRESDIASAASRLDVDIASIKAISEVESGGSGFIAAGQPVILYERHVAFRLFSESGGDLEAADQLAARYPNLINPKRGGYTGGAAEWSRLRNARQILPPGIPDEACSWGRFQIMGYHWKRLAYPSIDAFVAEMTESEGLQLDALIRFIEADPTLLKALRARKWADFAKGYNGAAYRENAYDQKLATAYARYQRQQENQP